MSNEFELDGSTSRNLVREMHKVIVTGEGQFVDGQMLLPSMGLSVGGQFTLEIWKHELVARALEVGDLEQEAWARRFVAERGLSRDRLGYVMVDREVSPNRVPNSGLNFVLNVLFYSTSKIATWYYGPFTSNWSPAAMAGSNWAGISSGPLAVELPDADFDESGRQAATFGSAAASQSITTSANTSITLATGTSGISVYGLTLNESATVAYNVADKILLAATRFDEAKTGLAAGDILNMGYVIGAAST